MKAKVFREKGEHRAEKRINRMLKEGWELQDHTTRKQAFSLLTGVFTRKQIHTLTFVKH